MSGPISLELQTKIATWRQRAAEGTLSQEEMKEAILLLRAGRVSAAAAASKSKAKKAAVVVDGGALLDELEGL